MNTLKEVKLKIFRTECKYLLYEGLFRSEPILTCGEKGLIDNYFIYASNRTGTLVSKPMAAFGIYSDIEETAYVNTDIYRKDAEDVSNIIDRSLIAEGYVEEYEMLYMEVRGFAFSVCDTLQKEKLRRYIEHLYTLSGSGLWENYLEIAPEFFDWAKAEGINCQKQ